MKKGGSVEVTTLPSLYFFQKTIQLFIICRKLLIIKHNAAEGLVFKLYINFANLSSA